VVGGPGREWGVGIVDVECGEKLCIVVVEDKGNFTATASSDGKTLVVLELGGGPCDAIHELLHAVGEGEEATRKLEAFLAAYGWCG